MNIGQNVKWQSVSPGPYCSDDLILNQEQGVIIGYRSGFLGIGTILIVKNDKNQLKEISINEIETC